MALLKPFVNYNGEISLIQAGDTIDPAFISGGGFTWTTITSANVATAATNTGYIMETGGTLRTVTLPVNAPAGFQIAINASGGQVRLVSNGNVIDGVGSGNDLLLNNGNTVSVVAKATGSLEILYGGATTTTDTNNVEYTVNGDFYKAVNASWDGTNWNRIDATKPAWLWQHNLANNMIGEGYKAMTLWAVDSGANPINAFTAVGGWYMVFSTSQFKDMTVAGYGIEIDGNFTFPYGRVQHATVGGFKKTGIMTNVYLDESGRDDTTKPSFFAGFMDDGAGGESFKIRFASSGATLTWNDRFVIDNTGFATINGNTLYHGGNLSFSGELSRNSGTGVVSLSTVPATKGGTGLTSFTAGNFLYAATSTTLAERTPTQVRADIGAAANNNASFTGTFGAYNAAAQTLLELSGTGASNYSGVLLWDGTYNKYWMFTHRSAAGQVNDFYLEHFNGTTYTVPMRLTTAGVMTILGNTVYHAGNLAFGTGLTFASGTVTNSRIPVTLSNAAYTFVASDAGKAIGKNNTTAYTYTVNNSIFGAGDVITVFNDSSTSNITIAAGTGVTLYLAGTTTTGSRIIAPRGNATIFFTSASVAYVGGAGVT
jgi:hypothetical protein